MKIVLVVLSTLFLFYTQMSFALPYHVMEKLVKRQGLESIQVVYANWETEDYLENKVPWGTRVAWGGIDNPFKDGAMPLVEFLDTFQLLVPDGGGRGVNCKDLYEAGTLITAENATIQKCTVTYGIFQLDMIVKDYSVGNAVEDSEISTFLPIGLRVVE